MSDTTAARSALFDALRQATGLFPVELDAQGACSLAFDQLAVFNLPARQINIMRQVRMRLTALQH